MPTHLRPTCFFKRKSMTLTGKSSEIWVNWHEITQKFKSQNNQIPKIKHQCPQTFKSSKISQNVVFQGAKIKQKVHQETILEAAVKLCSQQYFGDQHWAFQSDSAPTHRAHIQQLSSVPFKRVGGKKLKKLLCHHKCFSKMFDSLYQKYF